MAALAALAPLAACVSEAPIGPAYEPPPPTWVEAQVVSATPVYRDVRVAAPRQECQQVQVEDSTNRVIGTLVGGALGGLVGNQFGRGSGNAAMTAAGALGGAVVGNSIGGQSDGTHVETRCQTVNAYSVQSQPDGYDVAYRYGDQVYHTHSPVNPGATIRVQVNGPVAPPASYRRY